MTTYLRVHLTQTDNSTNLYMKISMLKELAQILSNAAYNYWVLIREPEWTCFQSVMWLKVLKEFVSCICVSAEQCESPARRCCTSPVEPFLNVCVAGALPRYFPTEDGQWSWKWVSAAIGWVLASGFRAQKLCCGRYGPGASNVAENCKSGGRL